MKILYNFASRSRPEKLIKVVENIINLSRHDNYAIIVTLDVDDPTVAKREFNDRLKSYRNVFPIYQFSKSKVDAINKNVWIIDDWDIVINVSDDILFVKEGFDVEIINDFRQYFTDLDGCIHYPDGVTQKKLMTMNIFGRKYFDRFGYIYHPDYINLWCDNESMEVAKILSKYVYIEKDLFRHLHPAWGLADTDKQYKYAESTYHIDWETFKKRQFINFGI